MEETGGCATSRGGQRLTALVAATASGEPQGPASHGYKRGAENNRAKF